MKKSNKFKLYNAIIIVLIFSVLLLGSTCVYLAISKDSIKDSRDIISSEYYESKEQLKSVRADLQDAECDIIDMANEIVELKNNIEMMEKSTEIAKLELEEYKKETTRYFINNYDLSDEEFDLLCRIVHAEAGIYGFMPKVNVTSVIINRVYSSDFPDTIEDVIMQERQFNPVSNGKLWEVIVTQETIDAVNYAIRSTHDLEGATFFMNESISRGSNVRWFKNNLEYVMTDESNHSFYKEKEE